MKHITLKNVQNHAKRHKLCVIDTGHLSSSPPLVSVEPEESLGLNDLEPLPPSAVTEDDPEAGPEADWEDMEVDDVSQGQTTELRRRKYQGVSVKLAPFIQFASRIKTAVYARQHHPNSTAPCSCHRNKPAIYRCTQCTHVPICASCIVQHHRWNPYHRIQRWNEMFFESSSLRDLGLILSLGHNGEPCPGGTPPRRLIIVDINGYHEVDIQFCCCCHRLLLNVDHDDADQLFHAELWPMTLESPQTAITFQCLEDFIVHSNSSKKSAYNYCYALQRLTDTTEPDKVPNCYRNFKLAVRVMRWLHSTRRSGHDHGINTLINHRRPGSTTINCPACPDPGFNVPMETVWKAPPEDEHKYTKFIALDGTFNVPRLKKAEDPDDEALLRGSAHVAEESAYQEYLDRCDVDCQEWAPFARVFFQDNSVVDMYGGERFSYGDHSLVGAIQYDIHQRWLRLSYNLWCQFKKNLRKRLTKAKFPGMSDAFWELLDRLYGSIPTIHILGHIWWCRALYAYTHQKKSGKTNPESIEGSWSNTKLCGGSTKHENHGQRHDDLDAALEDWNYNKMIKLSKSIRKQYVKSKRQYNVLAYKLEKHSAAISPSLLAKWQSHYDTPIPTDEDENVVDRYEVNFKGIEVPTLKQFMEEQLKREKDELCSETPTPGFSGNLREVLMEGVRLDHEQKDLFLAARPDNADAESLFGRRQILHDSILEWFQDLIQAHPSLERELKSVDPNHPEAAFLPLPSRLSPGQRNMHQLAYAQDIEYGFRKVQANAILNEVRGLIIMQVDNVNTKKEHIHGQSASTRAKIVLQRFKKDKKDAMERYNYVHDRLLQIGLSPDDTTLRKLQSSHLRGKDATKVAQPGEARMGDSWLWSVSKPGRLSEDEEMEWVIEIRRVKWFREKDECERWREEVEIVEAEMPRVIMYYDKYAIAWAKLAEMHVSDPGKRAYAFKRHSFYATLKQRAEVDWYKAQEDATTANKAAADKRTTEKGVENDKDERELRSLVAMRPQHTTDSSCKHNERMPKDLAEDQMGDTGKRKRDRHYEDRSDDSDDETQLLARSCRRRAKSDSSQKAKPKAQKRHVRGKR